jgi:UDP-glucose 4-epimerase
VRVLVTGGSGFVGKHTVEALINRGDEPVVVDLKPHPNPAIACIVGDLRDPSVVKASLTPDIDAVIHLAAITSVLLSKNDPVGVYETNVMASQYLLDRCRELDVKRLVFASTNAVVGNVGTSVINEEIPLRPLTPYGSTKAAFEMQLSAYASSYGLEPVALRFTNIYGAGMQEKDSVIARLMRAAMAGTGIEIYGDGEQLRDYLYVSDAVAAIELGLMHDRADTFTIGAGESVSMNDLHRLSCDATGRPIGATHIEGKPGEMPAVIVDISRAKRAGFVPSYSVLDGLKATWADFLERNGS